LDDYTKSQAIDPKHFNAIDKTHPYYSVLHPHLPSSYKNGEESPAAPVETSQSHHPSNHAYNSANLQPDELKYVDATQFSNYSPYASSQDGTIAEVTTAYPPPDYYSGQYPPTTPPKNDYYGESPTPAPKVYDDSSSDIYITPQPYVMKILQEDAYKNTPSSQTDSYKKSPQDTSAYEADNSYGLTSRNGGHGGSHDHSSSHSHHQNEGRSHGAPGPNPLHKPPPFRFNPNPSVKAALMELSRKRQKYNLPEIKGDDLDHRELYTRNSESPLYKPHQQSYTTTPSYVNNAPVPSYGADYDPTTPKPYELPSYSSYTPDEQKKPYPVPQDYTTNSPYPPKKPSLYDEYTTEAPKKAYYEETSADTELLYASPQTTATSYPHSDPETYVHENPYDKFYYVDHEKVDHGSLAHLTSLDENPNESTTSSPYLQPSSYDSTPSETPYTSPDKIYYSPTKSPLSYDPSPTSKPYTTPEESSPTYDDSYSPTTSPRYGKYLSDPDPSIDYTTSASKTDYSYPPPTLPSPHNKNPYVSSYPQPESNKQSSYGVETRAEHHQNANLHTNHHNKDHVSLVGHSETPSRVITVNNVKYKVISDTLTPQQSLDPLSHFGSETPNRPTSFQNNPGPTMDPQTARRVLEMLSKAYGAKTQQRFDPSQQYPQSSQSNTNRNYYLYNNPPGINQPTSASYQNSYYQLSPVRSESTQTYRIQGTRTLPSYYTVSQQGTNNNPSVARYPYRPPYYNNNYQSNQWQIGSPVEDDAVYRQQVYTTNSGTGTGYGFSYVKGSNGFSFPPKSLRRKRSVHKDRPVRK